MFHLNWADKLTFDIRLSAPSVTSEAKIKQFGEIEKQAKGKFGMFRVTKFLPPFKMLNSMKEVKIA